MSEIADEAFPSGESERIDSLLMDCIKIVDKSAFGDVYELNYKIGQAQSIIDELGSANLLHQDYIKNTREKISHLKTQAYEISLLKNPSDIERRKLAADVYVKFSERVPNNFRTTNRYILIAAATALVSSVNAISGSWEKHELVGIVVSQMYSSFIPSLILSAMAEVTQNISDAQYWSIWKTLTKIYKNDDNITRRRHDRVARVFSLATTILLSCATAFFVHGIYKFAEGVMRAKNIPLPF